LRQTEAMGVVGLGCDLLHVPRMEAALGRWGPRLLRKVLHADELSIFHLRSRPAQPAVLYLASRYALCPAPLVIQPTNP